MLGLFGFRVRVDLVSHPPWFVDEDLHNTVLPSTVRLLVNPAPSGSNLRFTTTNLKIRA